MIFRIVLRIEKSNLYQYTVFRTQRSHRSLEIHSFGYYDLQHGLEFTRLNMSLSDCE